MCYFWFLKPVCEAKYWHLIYGTATYKGQICRSRAVPFKGITLYLTGERLFVIGAPLDRLEEGTQTDNDSYYEGNNSSSTTAGTSSDSSDSESPSSSSVMDRLSNFFLSHSCSHHHVGTQTAKDPMTSQTERLAFDIIFFTLGRRKDTPSDDVTLTIRRCVSRMLDKHSFFFSGLVSRLRLRPGTDFRLGFMEVASELFAQDISWAKIISLFAFGARLAIYCSEKRLEGMVYDVATNLAEFAVHRLTPFLKEKGGWVSQY